MNFIGIDFGAKTAGTTAICYVDQRKLHVVQSVKNKSADDLIVNIIENQKPEQVFIDAPLSLPLAYYGKGTDFHYRACDREAKAMSPMFLGGLTARAIALKHKYQTLKFIESYPKMVAIRLKIDHGYKKGKITEDYLQKLADKIPVQVSSPLVNWHQIDATLAWMAGYWFNNGKHKAIGNPEEGFIIF